MLKFVPTSEEIELLSKHAADQEQMGKADLFFLAMSEIPHYKERLSALLFVKRFTERLEDTKDKVEGV